MSPAASGSMADSFDPYHHWLGIPPAERPVDCYRLLGVPRFEDNLDVISNAADARMAFIRTFQAGPKGVFSQQLLNELATARTTLLNPDRKAVYDSQLRASLQTIPLAALASVPIATSVPAQPQPVRLQPLIEIRTQPRPPAREPLPLLLIVGGLALPLSLLLLAVIYVATRGSHSPPIVQTPPVKTPAVPKAPPAEKPRTTAAPVETPPPVETPVVAPQTPAPMPTPRREEIDLLALVQTPRDITQGEVRRDDAGLSIRRRGGFTCAVIPYDMPANYQLDLRVTRREGNGFLIGLPIGGRACMITVDGFSEFGETRTALEMIDGRRPQEPSYTGKPHVGALLKVDAPVQLTVRVSGKSLQLACDGENVLEWNDDPTRLSVYGLFDQRQPKRLFIGSWAATYDIGNLKLQPLE